MFESYSLYHVEIGKEFGKPLMSKLLPPLMATLQAWFSQFWVLCKPSIGVKFLEIEDDL